MAIKNKEAWVHWNRPPKPGEANLRAELLVSKIPSMGTKHNYAVIFDNAFDLIDAVVSNVKKESALPNGSGAWRAGNMRLSGQWAYGNDTEIKDINSLLKYLSMGIGTQKANDIYTKELSRLTNQFPELQDLKEIGVTNRRRRIWQEAGDELDLDKYMNGDVEHWVSMRKQKISKRTCTIVYESGTTCTNQADSFVKSMCTLAALSDIVEASGISTEIIIAATIKGAGADENVKSVAIKAKQFEESLDIQRMLSMSNAAVLRCLVFGILENVSHNDKPGFGYGEAINIGEKKKIYSDLWGADIHVQGIDNFNGESNIKFMIGELKKVIEQNSITNSN